MAKLNKYGNSNNLNKPLFFMGLSSTQALICFLICIFSLLLIGFYSIIVISIIIYFARKIHEENKKGNPDYVNELHKKWFYKKYNYIDSTNLGKYLINKTK